MEAVIEIHEGRVIFAPLRKGKMVASWALSPEDARALAHRLNTLASEAESSLREEK